MASQTKTRKTASDKPRASKNAAATTDRAAAISKSWKDKGVAAARSTKNKVKVGGEEYRSVRAAFEALGLPESQHIAFRAELKAAGRKAFDGRMFSIVK